MPKITCRQPSNLVALLLSPQAQLRSLLPHMEILAAAARMDAVALRKILDTPEYSSLDINTCGPEDGRTALHIASSNGNIACLEILLRQPTIYLNATDLQGDTPLHLAATCREMDAVRLLLSYGPDLLIKNKQGICAWEYTDDPSIEALLQGTSLWKKTHLSSLENELPSDIIKLKELCIDLLIGQTVFEERCRDAIHQLIEEKHISMYKTRLMEQSAGIPDKETGDKYLLQLQFWQDEIERQSSTISYLKLRIQVLETTAKQQEDYYKHNVAELTRQHKEQVQAIFKRAEESERAFLNYQKKHSEDAIKSNHTRTELIGTCESGDPLDSASNSGKNVQLQEQFIHLQAQLDDSEAQRIMIEERLKSSESLKSLANSEAQTLRLEIDALRKNMTEKVMSQIEEGQQELNKRDEKDESMGEIVFLKNESGQKSVKAGTIYKLVERLVDPTAYDNQYLQALLLTHTVYMDSKDLLERITKICRDSIHSPQTPVELGASGINSSSVILKAANMIKYWMEQYWSDFQSDQELISMLNTFMETLENPKLTQMLKTCMNRKIQGTEAPVIEMPTQFPKPILPKSLLKRASADMMSNREPKTPEPTLRPLSAPWSAFNKKADPNLDETRLRLSELDPIEVARQLTLIEFELFQCHQTWMKDDKETRAPNIIRMVRWSNHVVHWLVTEIVSIKDNIKLRAATMERIIAIAQQLEKLNNFNGVKEVLAALQSSSVYRLKKTKELISGKYIKAFEELKRLTSSELNYKILRTKVHAVEPPLVPFPGVYQGDLVFLETCGKTKLDGNLINFQKFQKIASYVLELQTYQQVPYQLGPVPEIQDFLRSFQVLDDDQAYGLSLVCEPRFASKNSS
ncbi:hypothetical protein BASA62_004025 [Batrachochytrium salamandrivorans]|nr:hypothetical protein BASA62_004025 [Batrachochytrium salamandrivorans]